jgi:hypothetical protein
VYTLEKVLRLKKDGPATFLDEVMKVSSVTRLGIKLTSAQTLDDKPSFSFWTTLASRAALTVSASSWMQQALSTGYPRLLRLFHDFFAKIAVHTDTVYTRDHQR